MKTITKKVITIAMSLALVAGTLISPQTMMIAEASNYDETYTPENRDVDNGRVKIDTSAKTIHVQYSGNENKDAEIYTFTGFSGYSVFEIRNSNLWVRLDGGTYTLESGAIDTVGKNHDTTIIEAKEGTDIGTIYEHGAISVNNSIISTNYGSIENNKGDGRLNVNYGTVTSNSGRINFNKDSGRVENNTSDGTVLSNHGIIAANSGVIETNETSGRVYRNITGTITTDNGFSTTDPEPTPSSDDKKDNDNHGSGSNDDDSRPAPPSPHQLAQTAIFISLDAQLSSSNTQATIDGKDLVNALPSATMQKIAENPNVTVFFTYTYNDAKYTTAIPAGTAIDSSVEWYGPIYMMTYFPTMWHQDANTSVPVVAPVQ